MTDRDEEPGAVEGLAALRGGPSAPAGLEDRTVARLRAEGLLGGGGGRRRWIGGVLGVAAGLGGFVLGRVSARVAAPVGTTGGGTRRWMLLLLEDDRYQRPAVGREGERAAEYGRWLTGLRREGREVTGAELGTPALLVGSPEGAEMDGGLGGLSGYFVIGAGSAAEARAVAGTCPHLRYRGTIVVRPLL